MCAYDDVVRELIAKLKSLELLRSELSGDSYNEMRSCIEAKLEEARILQLRDTNTGHSDLHRNTPSSQSTPAEDTDLHSTSIESLRSHRARAAEGRDLVQVHTQGGDFVARDQYRFEYKQSPDQLLRAYYHTLAQDSNVLPIGIINPRFSESATALHITLSGIYTDLDVIAVPPTEDGLDALWRSRLSRAESGVRTPLIATLADINSARTLVLGETGSGKTSFVNYINTCLAAALAAGTSPSLPLTLKALHPVRLVLRHVARSIPPGASRGTSDLVWDALYSNIARHLSTRGADTLFPHLQQTLLNAPSLVLMDGLDEVPEAERRRSCLIEAIEEFASSLPLGSRVLLTARPYVYASLKRELRGFHVMMLAPFTPEQVRHFVHHWCFEVRPVMDWTVEVAQERAERLTQVLLIERPDLTELAIRPLLLTLIATLHVSGGQLPEDRADVYEETVKLLLSRWEIVRAVKDADGTPLREPGISRALGVGEHVIRGAIEKLAFIAQRSQPASAPVISSSAELYRGEVLATFEPILPADLNPGVLLRYLDTRAGLLGVGSQQDTYTFPHRSFQEYLAACHLANTERDFAAKMRELVLEDPARWREVFLLGVGKKRQGGLSDAINMINVLVPADPVDTEQPGPLHGRAALIGGEALVELSARARGVEYYESIVYRMRKWLINNLRCKDLENRERVASGDILGYLGDPRPGTGVASSDVKIPHLVWKEISAGPCYIGSPDGDQLASQQEQPLHEIRLATFFIGCYPITNAQYALFIKAGGYEEREFWTDEGWEWRKGAEACLPFVDDDEWRQRYQQWLACRPRNKRSSPFWWDVPPWNAPNRPVVGVTWFEAVAFCRWLGSTVLRSKHGQIRAAPTSHYHVSLPTEAQWEKAARGTSGFRWPWGNTWRRDACNSFESDIQQTSPVGIFTRGKSPYSVHDMAGNVWEWTSSLWGMTSILHAEHRYPYTPDGARNDVNGLGLRVLRGGSWDYQKREVRCAHRDRDPPAFFYNNIGFRVALTPNEETMSMCIPGQVL